MIECLVIAYCDQHGISDPSSSVFHNPSQWSLRTAEEEVVNTR